MNSLLFAASMLGAAAMASNTYAADASDKIEREKCYGVAKMGKNDCASKDKSHACAGQSKKDADTNAWVYVPLGLCEKLAGGVKG